MLPCGPVGREGARERCVCVAQLHVLDHAKLVGSMGASTATSDGLHPKSYVSLVYGNMAANVMADIAEVADLCSNVDLHLLQSRPWRDAVYSAFGPFRLPVLKNKTDLQVEASRDVLSGPLSEFYQ